MAESLLSLHFFSAFLLIFLIVNSQLRNSVQSWKCSNTQSSITIKVKTEIKIFLKSIFLYV